MSARFMDLPGAPEPASGARAALLGAGMAASYRGRGAYAAAAPAALRAASAGWSAQQANLDLDPDRPGWAEGAVVDCGDVALDPADGAGNRLAIRHAVADILETGAVPVVLGGDCSVAVPVLQALDGRGPVAVLQLDAHLDWREQLEGERWGAASAMRRASEMGQVAAMLQLGGRGLGATRPADVAAARDWGAGIVPAAALCDTTPEQALAALPAGMEVVVVLDLDALDPAVQPAVLAPAAGGLGYRQVLGLVRAAQARGPLAGLVLTGLVPERDIGGQGVRLSAQLLAALLGLLAGPDTTAA